MENTELPKYSIRDLSRETKKVLRHLPCLITYNKRVIAKIEHVEIDYQQHVQDLPTPATGGDREPVPADAKGELPSLLP